MRFEFGFNPPNVAAIHLRRFAREIKQIRNYCQQLSIDTGFKDHMGRPIKTRYASGFKLVRFWRAPLTSDEKDRFAWISIRGVDETQYKIEGAWGLNYPAFGWIKFVGPIQMWRGRPAFDALPGNEEQPGLPPDPTRNATTINDEHDSFLPVMYETADFEFILPENGTMVTAEDLVTLDFDTDATEFEEKDWVITE